MRGMIILLIIIIMLATLGCTGGNQTPLSTQTVTTPPPITYTPPIIDTKEAKLLFEIKCSLCHSLDRPASKKMSYEGWLSTVHRMISNGAPLTDSEAETVAAYLAIEYPKEQP